jgi:hypothetical protein
MVLKTWQSAKTSIPVSFHEAIFGCNLEAISWMQFVARTEQEGEHNLYCQGLGKQVGDTL